MTTEARYVEFYRVVNVLWVEASLHDAYDALRMDKIRRVATGVRITLDDGDTFDEGSLCYVPMSRVHYGLLTW